MSKTYARKDIIAMGPLYKEMKLNNRTISISFTYTGKGLVNKDGLPLKNFEIAGADGKFIPAKAEIKNNQVNVFAENIQHPVAVRFGWNEADHPNLYNKDGLPAMPFRTDNPLTEKFVK